jgi:ATP-dependent 26S proteasome regulatory subunit
MSDINHSIEHITQEQQSLKDLQMQMYENLKIMIENQKYKSENENVVIANQGHIIKNQEVIVSNQVNIINNQKMIVENQTSLTVILKLQALILQKLDDSSSSEVNSLINNLCEEAKSDIKLSTLNNPKYI